MGLFFEAPPMDDGYMPNVVSTDREATPVVDWRVPVLHALGRLVKQQEKRL